MKLSALTLSAILLLTISNAALAENACKAFVFYEGAATPEPTEVDCGNRTRTMKDCMAACMKVAQKNCPANVAAFNANVNFNSPTAGFEADNKAGQCKTKK